MDNERDFVFNTSIDFLNSLSNYAPEGTKNLVAIGSEAADAY